MPRHVPSRIPPRRRGLPALEALEGRRLPATITVLNLADAGAGSLRAAIDAANADPAPDTIAFDPAATGTIALLSALPDLSTPIALQGPGAATLTVARDAAATTPAFRLFTIPAGVEVAISGLTLANGQAERGGAIRNDGTLTIISATLRDNAARGDASGSGTVSGGAIDNAGTLSVASSTFSGNSAGIFGLGNFRGSAGGAISSTGTLTISASAFTKNSAQGGASAAASGGALYSTGPLKISASSLVGNSANGGGGAGFGGGGASGSGGGLFNAGAATVESTDFQENSAIGGPGFRAFGGAGLGSGIFNSGTLAIATSTVKENSARGGVGALRGDGPGQGGGIDSPGALSVLACTIATNGAFGTDGLFSADGIGGGLSIGGTATIALSTIGFNAAVGGSGAGSIGLGAGLSVTGTATISDSTIAGNVATQGGGIALGLRRAGADSPARLTLANTILSDLAGGTLAINGGAVTSDGHNLFSDSPAIAFAATDLVATDPLLGPLTDNGGPTWTQSLLPGSPAIDAGAHRAGIATDQRGIARPQGAAPDIGAYESRGFTLAIVSGDGQTSSTGEAFASPLVVSVTSPFGETVAGGRVAFTAPASGASAALAGTPVTIGQDGRASLVATANETAGVYAIAAQARGAASGAAFSATNVDRTPPTLTSAGTARIGLPSRHPRTIQTVSAVFSEGVTAAIASRPKTYILRVGHTVRKKGIVFARAVPLKSALYDATTHTVTLIGPTRLPRGPLQLTVKAASGLADSAGNRLPANIVRRIR